MILTKEVNVTLNSSNISYYENLGYKIPREYDSKGRFVVKRGTKMLVKLKDLPTHSKEKIEVKCDNCGKIFKIEYVQYNRLKSENKNLCKKCKGIHWHYNIGDKIVQHNIDFTITDRCILNSNQCYKFKCNKCGFDCGEHINVKYSREIRNEFWITYGNLKKEKNCPCCSGHNNIIVTGINDIATTDKWMVKYFKFKEDAYKYSSTSGETINMICPNCNEERKMQICVLKNTGYLPCICRKECSIPNKISFYVLKELEANKIIHNYKREYSPKWAGLFSYDNFFMINNTSYIIEMDGGFHYKDNNMNGLTARQAKERDNKKDKLAIDNNINMIRVFSPDGEKHKIYENLLTELNKIVDISILSEEKIMEKVHKNFVKIICDFFEENKSRLTMGDIANNFNIHVHTLRDYLKFGNQYNWCNYTNKNELKKSKKEIVIDLFINKNLEQKEIAKLLNIHERTVLKYINEERKLGNIPYGNIQTSIKAQEFAKRLSKTVYVYDINKNYINTYNSTSEIERRSLIDFGTNLQSRSISRVCLGKRSHYKNLIFSYKPLENQNNDSLLLCQN